ncbi:MAG: hypothetical protein QW372_01780 [Nitrososphaerales archaeon]
MVFKRVVIFITSLLCSLLIGKLIGIFMMWCASVNVKVRPELLKLSWVEALISGHFTDWFMVVNEPYAGILGMIFWSVIGVLAGLIIAYKVR